MSPACQAFWDDFRETSPAMDLPEKPFDICMIGVDRASGDIGAQLVLSGIKTATSSLPQEFPDGALPYVGALSLLTDGSGVPAAIFRTTQVEMLPFDAVGEEFAHAYGEWDQTLATWRERNRNHYAAVCERLGLSWHDGMQIVCEFFRVIHPARA